MGYSPWGRKESDTAEVTQHSTAWQSRSRTYGFKHCLLLALIKILN